jgi:putative transposase
MRLVEQHIIEKGDPRFKQIDQAAFASKNLYNAANYLVRQTFIFQGFYLDNVQVFHQIKSHEAYVSFLAKSAIKCSSNWTKPGKPSLKRW